MSSSAPASGCRSLPIRRGERLTNRPANCWDDFTPLRASIVFQSGGGKGRAKSAEEQTEVAVAEERAAGIRRDGAILSPEIAEALAPSFANRNMRGSACTDAEAMHDPCGEPHNCDARAAWRGLERPRQMFH